MKERIIKVEPFSFIDFRQVDIYKKLDIHGRAFISGMIAYESASDYLSSKKHTMSACIHCYNEDNVSEKIFDGLIEKMWVEYEGDIALLNIELISHSFEMDIVKHTRTFQDKNMTYGQVAGTMTTASGLGSIISPLHSGKMIGSMAVQYGETDWQFARRLASRLNTFIVPDNLSDTPAFSIGKTSKRENVNMEFKKYSIVKDNAEYLTNKNHGIVADYTYYKTESRHAYELCSTTTFHGAEILVCEVESHLVGEELMHYYTLKPVYGVVKKEYYNNTIIGMSLTGNILEIEKDMVKVKIHDDVEQTAYKWFSYATVYSSPDNTGWYFMPETGDEAKLHFPDEIERSAYVMNSVHLEGRDDADTKSIRTKWGKEVVFTPTSIFINNGAGSSITLDNSAGIHMNSTKKIKVTADDNITLDAVGKVKITGDKGVVINQTANQISVDDNIDISAGHVRIR